MRSITNDIEIHVKVKDQAEAIAGIKAIEQAAKSLSGTQVVDLKIEVDDNGAAEKIRAAAEAGNAHATVKLDVDGEYLRDKVEQAARVQTEPLRLSVDGADLRAQIQDAAGATDVPPVQVPLEADASKLAADAALKAKAARKPDPIKVRLETDSEAFERELRESFAEGEKHAEAAAKTMSQSFTALASGSRALQAALKDLNPVTEGAGEAVEDFETQFRKAMDEGARVSEEANRAMRQSFTSIESGSRTLRAAMEELTPAVENAGSKAEEAGKKAARSGADFRLGGVGMTAMMSAAIGLAPALAALPAVGGAFTVGLGTMALGLGGVTSALKDYGQQSTASGTSGAQAAQTAFSNARAIASAEDAITQAKKQAAQAAQSSADAIYSAQERVTSSAYSLKQAEQSLTDAEKTAADAQKALTQARADAANQLIDLNNAAADSNIAVQQAELNLTEAREKLITVTSSGLYTDDQKKQAQLDVLSATQGLKDAQQHQTEAQQKANDANRAGVDGMAGVVSAQNAVAKANEGVASAQHGVATASQAQADAQKALARAVADSAQQQQDSAAAIAKAEQNLSDTYKQQQLAAEAAAASGGGAVDKFAADMAKLTPAGRAFVNQLLSMRGGLDELKNTAQTSMLPGLTTMLKDSAPMLPIFNKTIGDMGHIIGDTGKQFGTLMQSPAFQGQMTKVLGEGADLAGKFAGGMTGLVSGIMKAGANAGPIVSGIADGIKTLMTSGIPDFLSNLTANATQIGQGFNGLLTLVSNLAGPLGTVANGVATALAPALVVLSSPQVSQALSSIGTSLAQIMIALSPVVTMLAQGLAGALRVVAPLLASVAKFIQDNHRWVVPLGEAVAIATIAWWGFNAAMAANPLVLVAGLVAGLVVGLIYAWEHFKGFRDFIKAMWADIAKWFGDFLGFVKKWWPELLAPFTLGMSLIIGHWNDIVEFTKKLPGRLASAAAHLWDWVTQLWDKYVGGPVSKAFDTTVSWVAALPGRFARAGSGLWDWIRDSFKAAINTVIGWWDSLSFGIPKVHIPGTDIDVGGGSIGVPQIPYFAAGGAIGRGGWAAVVNDRGPEVLRLPDGTQVMPNANARSMMAAGAGRGPGGGAAAVQVELVSSGAEDMFLRFLRHAIRVRGGNVQKVLGVS